MGKGIRSNLLLLFLANIVRRSRNDEIIEVFQNSPRKGPEAIALTLEYIAGVPSKATPSGREKKTNFDPHPKEYLYQPLPVF